MPRLTVSYSRVSHITQNLDRQINTFTSNQLFSRHYSDKVSGAIPFKDRPAGARVIRDCLNGEIGTIHFHAVDRIGRNVPDMITTLYFFIKHKIQVIIEQENIKLLLDDGSVNPAAQIVLSVLGTLAEVNRNRSKIAQMEGIRIRQLRGLYTGRKLGTNESIETFMNKPKSLLIIKLLNEETSVAHISAIAKTSVNTVKKVKKLLVSEHK
jgi:DNA invertase Pin-like site-specific DNA recombinase